MRKGSVVIRYLACVPVPAGGLCPGGAERADHDGQGAGRRHPDRRLRRPAAAEQRRPRRGRTDHRRRHRRLAAGPARRRGDLHRRHERAARPLGHARPPHAQRAQRLRALGQDLPAAVRVGDHAGRRPSSCCWPASPARAISARRSRRRSTSATASTRERFQGATVYVSGPFIQHEPYPGTEAFRWGVKGADDARAKVAKLADAGVDVIKLIDQDQMTMEEVARRRRRGAPPQPAGRGALPSARGDPPRARGRRRQLRAHRTRRRAGVSRRHHPHDSRARGQHGGGPALLDADDRRSLQLRVHPRQPRAHRRSRVARRAAAGDRRRHPQVARASRTARLLPRHARAPADARAQVRAAPRSGRDAARSAPTAASR